MNANMYVMGVAYILRNMCILFQANHPINMNSKLAQKLTWIYIDCQ